MYFEATSRVCIHCAVLLIQATGTRASNVQITYCSSGLGLAIAGYALNSGDKVVATLRGPERLSNLAAAHPESLLVPRLDVTAPSDVTAAFAASKEKFGGIDVVVDNAGARVLGEVEGTAENAARGVFDVNFWGASHVSAVSKGAVRFFREENKPMGGRLVQVSSASALQSRAGGIYYSAR